MGLVPTVRGNKGMTIVEFAVVLPLLFAMIFSIIDFGLYFFAQHTLQFATREGVRLALVGRVLEDESGDSMSRETSIVRTIQDHADLAIDPAKLRISIYPIESDFSDPSGWEDEQDAGMPGSLMRVRTHYDYKFITPFLGALFTDGKLAVRAQATYKNEIFNN